MLIPVGCTVSDCRKQSSPHGGKPCFTDLAAARAKVYHLIGVAEFTGRLFHASPPIFVFTPRAKRALAAM